MMRPGQFFVERERAPKLCDRVRSAPVSSKRRPQAVMRGREILVFRERRAIRTDGAFELALPSVGKAEAVMRFGVRRFAIGDRA